MAEDVQPKLKAWTSLNEGGRWRVDIDLDIELDTGDEAWIEPAELRAMIDAVENEKARRKLAGQR